MQVQELVQAQAPARVSDQFIPYTDLDYFQDRERAIQQIEAQQQIVSEMFADVALLVAQQGESVDLIVNNIERAVEHTTVAVAELETAQQYQPSYAGMIGRLFSWLLPWR